MKFGNDHDCSKKKKRDHILKSPWQIKCQHLKEINFIIIQIQKGAPSNVMCYQIS